MLVGRKSRALEIVVGVCVASEKPIGEAVAKKIIWCRGKRKAIPIKDRLSALPRVLPVATPPVCLRCVDAKLSH